MTDGEGRTDRLLAPTWWTAVCIVPGPGGGVVTGFTVALVTNLACLVVLQVVMDRRKA